MQSTVPSSTMQPQSAQNMYVPAGGTNSTGQVRANQQTGGIYRGPPTGSQAPRSAATQQRHVPMQQMYQQQMHQGVVMSTYPQFQPRQPQYQAAPQYSFPQPIPTNFFPFQYYSTMQQPQAHQRGAVGVSGGVGVGVGSPISVQTAGPNGPLSTGPPSGAQAQIPLTTGTVITAGAVPPVGGAVLGVPSSATGQQVGVQLGSLGVVPTQQSVPQQSTSRRRKHALDIIDPNTKKNILDELELSKSTTNSKIDYQEQIQPHTLERTQMDITSPPPEHPTVGLGSGVIVMTSDARPGMAYSPGDIHQVSQQRDIAVSQTPIVSAMSDAPSVEILPTPQKPRSKKIPIVQPRDEHETPQNASKIPEDTKELQKLITKTPITDSTVVVSCQNPELADEQHYQKIQVPQDNTDTDCSSSRNVLAAATETVGGINVAKEFDNTVTARAADLNTSSSCAISQAPSSTVVQQEVEVCSCTPTEGKTSEVGGVGDTLQTTMQLNDKDANSFAQDDQKSNKLFTSNGVASSSQTTPIIDAEHFPKDATQSINNNNNNNGSSSSTITVAADDIAAANNNNTIVQLAAEAAVLDKSAKIEGATTVAAAASIAPTCDETDRAVPAASAAAATLAMPTTAEMTNSVSGSETVDNLEIVKIQPSAATSSTTAITPTPTPVPTPTTTNTSSSAIPETNSQPSSSAASLPTATPTPAPPATPQMLINYNEGQWSPNNPTGRKQYDREQLLQLREAMASRVQPEVKNVSILPQANLMPSFVKNSNKRVQSMVGSIGGGGGGGGGGNRGGDGGNIGNFSKQASMSGVHARGSMKGMIHVNLSLNQDVKLSETDNAWRPRAMVKHGDSEQDIAREKEELIRRVRGILNKLTPEKFDTLVEEIIKLKIDTPDKVEDVMVLVFEKAIDEPNFSVSYARLCHRLITEVKARDERMESGTKTNLAHFRNALLDKTEREFTQNVIQSSAKEKKLQPIIDKIKKCEDQIEKAELEALLEEEERKIRRRSGGTVRFIGELFKISMLTGKIIHSCIETLLNPNSEDMLECMCKLLTTVGAKFEQTVVNPKDPPRCYSLDKVMQRMQAIALKTDKEAKVSSRVRFMLQDVIDLRKNKWQSTRNEAPKTMEQIEKETKTEQLSSQYLNYAAGPMAPAAGGSGGSQGNAGKRDDRGGGGRYGDSRGGGGGYGGSHSQRGDTGSLRRQQQGNERSGNTGGAANGNSEDTWHVQTSKGGRSLAVDTNKLEGLQSLDLGTKKMGGASLFQWNNAARQQTAPTTTTPSNPFAALSALADSNRGNDRDRDRDRDRSGPRNKGSYNKGSMERDRYGDRGMHTRSGSSQASRENSSSRGPPPQGMRGMMNPSSMQKSTSHSKYTQQQQQQQQMPPSSRMTSGKPSGISSLSSGANNSTYSTQQRADQPSSAATYTMQHQLPNDAQPSAAPPAVFEEPNDSDMKIIKSVIVEMVENLNTSKTINTSTISCFNHKIKDTQRCGFLYYILTDYLHLRDVLQIHRRHLANIVAYLIKHNFLSVEHFHVAYKHFSELASELIVDIPELWLYVFEFAGPLIQKKIITPIDLCTIQLEDSSAKQKFLKTFLAYCTREIGPSFTRNMWKKYNMKWTDFIEEHQVKNFIESNKLEFVENDSLQPCIAETKEPKEKLINRVIEHVDYALKDGANADSIVDYINGNITDIDKQFIRSLTTVLCDFSIIYKDSSYALDTSTFQKICIPILQRYLDSKEDRELECLYSMQLLVHNLEHPRGLLNELFFELLDADVIPQDSFIKWRDSKDQSAGKGVAVKGLNQFFNQLLNGETSDENN